MFSIRDLIYFSLIAALGFFLSSLILGSSVHFDNIVALLSVSALFTLINFTLLGRTIDSLMLFFVNVFIIYVLDVIFLSFTVQDFWPYFIIAFIISVVDALLNDNGI